MENTFTKVGSYQYSSEAIIIKGKLEAEGIEVFMADGFTIDTDPLVSNAIGGVKLFVKTIDTQKAQEILTEISRYSVDDKGEPLTCSQCGSHEIEVGTTIKDLKSLLGFVLGLLLVFLPFYTKYNYRCNNCGNEFNIQ
jgi:DNA-directed RNA polymerase subunit RPC12/RpoP